MVQHSTASASGVSDVTQTHMGKRSCSYIRRLASTSVLIPVAIPFLCAFTHGFVWSSTVERTLRLFVATTPKPVPMSCSILAAASNCLMDADFSRVSKAQRCRVLETEILSKCSTHFWLELKYAGF